MEIRTFEISIKFPANKKNQQVASCEVEKVVFVCGKVPAKKDILFANTTSKTNRTRRGSYKS